MNTNRKRIGLPPRSYCMVGLAYLTLNAGALLAQRTKARPTPGRPAPSAPAPASAASSGELRWSPNALAVGKAFRVSLRNPAVRQAARGEVLRQLKSNRPVAFVAGQWVTPVDLSRVYAVAPVRDAMLAALGANPVGTTLAGLGRQDLAARLGLVFTPNQFGAGLLGDFTQDLAASLARDLFATSATGMGIPVAIGIGIGTGIAGSLIANWLWSHWNETEGPVDGHTGLPIDDPNADPDGDGINNKNDGDDDNDGTKDKTDASPYDPNVQICFSCTGIQAIGFGNANSRESMGVWIDSYRSISQATAAQQVQIGQAPRGQAMLTFAFPAAIP